MNAVLYSGFENMAADLGISAGMFWGIFALLAVWTLTLKGIALWHAARNHQRRWFVVILILNTFGILELVYLIWFRKDTQEGRTQSLFNTPAER